MSQQPANADPVLAEQLVAYLDGELAPEASRRVEELLASDPKVRRTLQGLDRTWELLEKLETPQVAESFTRRRRRGWVIVGGSLLAAGLAGFLAVAIWPHPNRQLIDDLPMLKNLDGYRQIDNIEFLRMLDKEGVFPLEEDGDDQ
ncbi:MAG: anti-sigma factor family protein [Planctomycetota bacterium]|jgi:ferric-dicitrate binding protein FerR (iron transport regulator)